MERGTHLEQPEEGDLIRRAALGDGDFLGVVQDILHDLRIRGVTGEDVSWSASRLGWNLIWRENYGEFGWRAPRIARLERGSNARTPRDSR